MGCIKLAISESNSTEQGMRVYRSLSVIDTNALPAPIVSLAPNSTGYDDSDVLPDTDYHYVVSAFRGSEEVFSSETIFSFTINQPPVLTVPNATGTDGLAFTVTASAIDPEGDTITFSLSGEPAGLTIGSSSGIIDWNPAIEGVYNFDVIATDTSFNSDTVNYTLIVGNTTFSEPTNLVGVYSEGAGGVFVPPYNLSAAYSFNTTATFVPPYSLSAAFNF